MPNLVTYAAKLPNVVVSEEYLSMCTEAGATLINQKIKENNLNRIVILSCTPKTHLPVFKKVLKESGLDPNYLEFVNIREHCSFVHMLEKSDGTDQSKDLVRAAVEKVRQAEIIPIKKVQVEKEVLIIGGGIAGMQAALDLGDQGLKVHLVEKSTTIGGNAAKLDRIFPTDDCCI